MLEEIVMQESNGMNLFDLSGLSVLSSEKSGIDHKIRCHWVNYVGDSFEDPMHLFEDFHEIKVISFSFNFGFVARIASKFKHAQIVLGAEFTAARMNTALAKQASYILANADEIRLSMHRNKRFAKRVLEGEVEVRYPVAMIDHRKLYLLKANNGSTRVIMPSANISARAWICFNQIENYVVCDDPAAYEAYSREFDTIWDISESVVPNARVSDEIMKADKDELPDRDILGEETQLYDVAKDNPLIESAEKSAVDTAIVVREVDDPDVRLEIVQYTKDVEQLEGVHHNILKEIRLKESKNHSIKIVPETIKKYLFQAKKASMKIMNVEKRSEQYPRMVVDYATGEVFLNSEKMYLNPSVDAVKTDARELLSVFANFDNFVGRVRQAKINHFKLMNALFCSPFNAKLRCAAYLRDIDTSGLPLYILLNSPANCGKTFMVKYFLKMMTGKKNLVYRYTDVKSDSLKAFFSEGPFQHKGVPIFIDEVMSTFKISFGGLIRTVEDCEEKVRELQPLTVFASNAVSDPDTALRKRMVFLTFDIGLPSEISPREFRAEGKHLINRIGTSFYAKYLSYMIPYVAGELTKIETGEGLTDKYAPELMKKSSEIILQIIKECGLDIPDYMTVLSWDVDYADNSRSVYIEVIEKLINLYKTERNMFDVDKKYVTISLSNDREGKKLVSNCVNLLPKEIQAELIPDAHYAKIRLNREDLEHHFGFQLDSGLLDIIRKIFKRE